MISVRRRSTLAVVVWLAGCAAALVVALRTHYVADLSAFLPAAPTAEQAVLLDQLRSGAASRLVLIGIAGGDAAARAGASKRLAEALRGDARFTSINNGDTAAYETAGRLVFERRYVLSPAVDAARFGVEGLRSAIDDTVSLLGTPAGALLKPILYRDPTGETLRIAEALTPARSPRVEGGVWVSRTAPRAVLVATTAAEGADLDGQEAALAAVRTAFARVASPPTAGTADAATAPASSATAAASASSPAALRLELSGAGHFGVLSRERIRSEAERLALFGSALIVGLLVVAFASLRSLAIALLPVVTGVLAGITAVSLGFGQVHGMTLGFGTTLIGEAVDYAIYFLIQTRAGAGSSAGWIRDSWPTVRLGLFTSLIGFAALVFAGFPGLAQLGVFSVAGLAAAAATTRFVFPVLAGGGAPGMGLRRQLGRAMQALATSLPRARYAVLVVTAAAVAVLVALPSPWRGELAELSPIDAASLALDASLRSDVGASDAGSLVAVSAPSEAEALAGAEAVGQRLDALVRAGTLAGYDSPARFLPSSATQAARRAALPDASTLAARLEAASAGGPIDATRLAPFIADVDVARGQPPVTRAALAGTPLAAAVDALLLPGDGTRPWRALVNLQAVDGKALPVDVVRAAIEGVGGARLVSVKSELDAIYANFLRQAEWQAGLGALAIAALLGWHLRSVRRLAAVALPVAAAALVVLAALAASGVALGILHLVGLLLTVAIGSNYALFFDHLRHAPSPLSDTVADGNADTDTLASLLLANLTTVVSFTLLALSSIPVLQAIGIVVAPGALLCLLLSATLIPAGSHLGAHDKIAPP